MFREKILKTQQKDVDVQKVRSKVRAGVETPFQIFGDGVVVMDKKMYLSDDQALKNEVPKEAHEYRFVVRPGSTKMYMDLKEFYLWPNMKK